MYDNLVVGSDKRNLPEIKRTLYRVMVRHYGAVLEAVFHSYTDIWLLCGIVVVEHTADNKQMLCQQQKDGYICRHSILQDLITTSKGREICREGKCIIMALSLLTYEYVQMLCFCGNGEAALRGRRYVGVGKKMHTSIYSSASVCGMKIETVVKRNRFQSQRRQQFTTRRLQVLINLKKTSVHFYSTVRGYKMDSVTMETQILTTEGRCQYSVECYGTVRSEDSCLLLQPHGATEFLPSLPKEHVASTFLSIWRAVSLIFL